MYKRKLWEKNGLNKEKVCMKNYLYTFSLRWFYCSSCTLVLKNGNNYIKVRQDFFPKKKSYRRKFRHIKSNWELLRELLILLDHPLFPFFFFIKNVTKRDLIVNSSTSCSHAHPLKSCRRAIKGGRKVKQTNVCPLIRIPWTHKNSKKKPTRKQGKYS